MKSYELEEKWSKIIPPITAHYSYQRIDSICIPDVRIGLSSENNRCLILKLNSKNVFEFKNDEKENLKTYYDKHEKSIVLELLDSFYNQLFTDLVISLYQLLKDIQNEEYSTQLFISTVGYWSDFLKAKRTNLLSEQVIQGLYGELVFLEYLIENSNDPINNILSSWRGPYNANHDFHFTNKTFEVKTKRKNSNTISISSENQLEAEIGKRLELVVITVDLIKRAGDTLKDILNRIRLKALSKGGNISILSDALAEKKLTFINVVEYDHFQFKNLAFQFFECDHPSFPKLVRNNINDALHNVTYNLTLSRIDVNLLIKTIESNEY